MNIDHIVQRFKFLGLTEYQSRVLYALLKNKSCSIAEISKLSGVPNTRVYDVVKQLMNMDYVLQISNKPKLYRVRNVDLVLDNLYSKKEREFEEVKNELAEIKKFFKDDTKEESNKLIKVDKEIDFIKVLNEELSNANSEIIGFGSKELNNKLLKNTLLKAKNNNINVKLLTHPEVKVDELKDLEVKPLNHNLTAYLIDDNKLIVKLSKNDEDVHQMSVLNDHKGLKNMVKTYFNYCWNQE